MRYLQEIIITGCMGLFALEIIPLYGDMVGSLFGQVSDGLILARTSL